MDVSLFIASRLRFKGKMAVICIAVSFVVTIIAVSISSGYRHEIRAGLSRASGDVLITAPDQNVLNEERPIEAAPAYLPHVSSLPSVAEVIPVVYRAGIVRHDGNIYGVMLKGSPEGVPSDSLSLAVSIPAGLAEKAGLAPGDRMLTYFVGGNVKLRQFSVAAVHDDIVGADDRYVVYASNADLQRLNGWDTGQVSALEVMLEKGYRTEEDIRAAGDEIGFMINAYASKDEEAVVAMSSVSRFPRLFNWLEIIDFNVLVIIVLMIIVAGFNMISGLLIILFENISTIGLLKSLGMTDRAIAKVFLASSASITLKGMIAGNLIALIFCLIQSATHILKLDPENYFVSFVPVHADIPMILVADAVSFAAIMLMMLIPCMFISKVDPAQTVRVR